MKKWSFIRKIVIISLVVVCSLVLLFLRYKSCLDNLVGYKDYKLESSKNQNKTLAGLNEYQSLMLGWVYCKGNMYNVNRAENSFLDLPPDKKNDVVRVGIFGCSYTAGDEVEKGFDFSSFLKRNFKKNGFNNVEVINFGVSAYGMHQSFLLWDFVGRYYHLDYVIFPMFDFYIKRDSSFVFSRDEYDPVHARYILKDGGLKLVEVSGKDMRDARLRYFGIFPPLRYIRYDYRMPFSLESILPSCLKSRTNPFYYRSKILRQDSDIENEIISTYSLMLKEVKSYTKNVIVIADKYYRYKDSLPDGVYSIKNDLMTDDRESLYYAPKHHWSPFGNELVGKLLFNMLVGNASFDVPLIDTFCFLKHRYNTQKSRQDIKHPYEYEHIFLSINKSPIGKFFVPDSDVDSFDFKSNRTKNIFSICQSRASRFFALPFCLQDKEKVFLSFSVNSKKQHFAIGAIDLINPIVGVMALNIEKIKSQKSIFEFEYREGLRSVSFCHEYNRKNVKDVCIQTKDNILIRGVLDKSCSKVKKYVFEGVYSKVLLLNSAGNLFVQLDNLPKYGHLDLVLEDASGDKTEIPFLKYKIKTLQYKFKKPYKNPIRRF